MCRLASYTLPNEVENLRFEGTGAFSGTGNGLANQMFGGASGDTLTGLAGNDALLGLAGNDVLDGGAGVDQLTGGAGADTFRFQDGSTGPGAAADQIADFASGSDKIDLSAIDANTATPGDQPFTFIAGAPFSSVAGQLRYVVAGGAGTIEGDTNGDGVADLRIVVSNSAPVVGTDVIP